MTTYGPRLAQYVKAAMKRSRYEFLPEDDHYFGHIPGLRGTISWARTRTACRRQLESVLIGWLIVCSRRRIPIPPLAGIRLTATDLKCIQE